MSLISKLRELAEAKPDHEAFVFTEYDTRSGDRTSTLTWRQVYVRASNLARYLNSLNDDLERQKFAAICAPQGIEYIVGFLGALFAGWCPVPLPEPQGGLQDKRTGLALLDCSAAVVLTTAKDEDAVRATLAAYSLAVTTPVIALDTFEVADVSPSGAGDVSDFRPPEGGMYLQYTSGSTGNPRGARISLENVEINFRQIAKAAFPYKGTEVSLPRSTVSWLPLYHDMGLMVGLFIPVYCACPSYFMSPAAFVRKPIRWMRMLAERDQPFTAAPNFAFDLATSRISDADMSGIDLAHVSAISNGGERVQPNTVDSFLERFSRYGLRPEVVKPSYGMAEAVVYVAISEVGTPPVSTEFDAQSLANGHAELKGPDAEHATRLVRYHKLDADPLVRIVDPESCVELSPGGIGEIWVHGGNLSSGYHNVDNALNKEKFHATIRDKSPGTPRSPWLRTGDLGFEWDGGFYIVGRSKDLIIQDGVNHYPDDIENTVKEFTRGRVAAFSIADERSERLVIVAEVKPTGLASGSSGVELPLVKKRAMAALSRLHGLHVADFLFVPPQALPKTTSGKISRSACAKRYLSAGFEQLEVPQ